MRSGGNHCYGLRFEGSVLKALKAQAQADVPDMADQADLPAVVDVVDVVVEGVVVEVKLVVFDLDGMGWRV